MSCSGTISFLLVAVQYLFSKSMLTQRNPSCLQNLQTDRYCSGTFQAILPPRENDSLFHCLFFLMKLAANYRAFCGGGELSGSNACVHIMESEDTSIVNKPKPRATHEVPRRAVAARKSKLRCVSFTNLCVINALSEKVKSDFPFFFSYSS